MINAVGNRMTREIARQQKLADALERTQIQISGGKKLHDFSRDEFVAMADVGEEAGQIDEIEKIGCADIGEGDGAARVDDGGKGAGIERNVTGGRWSGDHTGQGGAAQGDAVGVIEVKGAGAGGDHLAGRDRGMDIRLEGRVQLVDPVVDLVINKEMQSCY